LSLAVGYDSTKDSAKHHFGNGNPNPRTPRAGGEVNFGIVSRCGVEKLSYGENAGNGQNSTR